VETDPREQAAASAGELAGQVGSHVEGAQQLLVQSQQAAAAIVDRFVEVKRREVEAHDRAVALHEQAAALQARLGHPERASRARAHADTPGS
jgi:hypothetical protein